MITSRKVKASKLGIGDWVVLSPGEDPCQITRWVPVEIGISLTYGEVLTEVAIPFQEFDVVGKTPVGVPLYAAKPWIPHVQRDEQGRILPAGITLGKQEASVSKRAYHDERGGPPVLLPAPNVTKISDLCLELNELKSSMPGTSKLVFSVRADGYLAWKIMR